MIDFDSSTQASTEDEMTCGCREPTLKELLSDSIVEAVMRADDVDPERLDAMLSRIASELQADGRIELAHSSH
jgi:hypothetical protein